MTTLIGNEVFEYLSYLDLELGKKIPEASNGDFSCIMHRQMRGIIDAEKTFLRYVNSTGTRPVLSISPDGLPSVASLNPDLEKMCELSESEKSLGEISRGFRKGIKGKNNDGEDRQSYAPVSGKEYAVELKRYTPEQLNSQIGFAVSETDDGKFELAMREDLYLKGYDLRSREFPVLIREGRAQYHVVWNRLIENCEESFYVSNTALVLQGKIAKPRTKIFDDISKFYSFNRKDYKPFSKRIPFFGVRNWRPGNYAQFLSAGTRARVAITNNILETIGGALGRQVNLKGFRRNDLERVLAFSEVPFKNAPQTTPKEEDLFEMEIDINKDKAKRVKSKFPTAFYLVYGAGAEKVGDIEYHLPMDKIHICHGSYGGTWREDRFTLGAISLNILGSAISNEEQFKKIQEGLKKIEKR